MSAVEVKVKDSLVSACINGVINGLIAYFEFRDQASIPISLDAISTNQISVWGQAVTLTFGLGIILTIITSKVFISHIKKQNLTLKAGHTFPDTPAILKLAAFNAAILFGWFVTLAVIWTKWAGEVFVSATAAAVLVGLFAVVVTLVVEVRTKSQIIFIKNSIFNDAE